MLIRRQDPNYYQGWFSCKELDNILRKVNLANKYYFKLKKN